MNCAICKQTAPKIKLRRAVQSRAVLGEQQHFQQWRGFQAHKYANWYCADTFLRGGPRSLQVLDLKGKNELRNCAPLKGGSESRAVRLFAFPLAVAVQCAGPTMPSPEARP